jgi:hypothetical protein
MKKIVLFATAFLFTLAAMAQPKADDVIKLNVDKHDFGKIKQNEPVTYYFVIKNISDKPVVVENTWASCGCTTPEKIVEPIMPDSSAKLKVQYNAAAVAPFTKDVYIKLVGIEAPKSITITGEVLDAAAYEAYKKGNNNQPNSANVKQPATQNTKPSTTPTTTSPKLSTAPVKN